MCMEQLDPCKKIKLSSGISNNWYICICTCISICQILGDLNIKHHAWIGTAGKKWSFMQNIRYLIHLYLYLYMFLYLYIYIHIQIYAWIVTAGKKWSCHAEYPIFDTFVSNDVLLLVFLRLQLPSTGGILFFYIHIQHQWHVLWTSREWNISIYQNIYTNISIYQYIYQYTNISIYIHIKHQWISDHILWTSAEYNISVNQKNYSYWTSATYFIGLIRNMTCQWGSLKCSRNILLDDYFVQIKPDVRESKKNLQIWGQLKNSHFHRKSFIF